MEHKLLLVDDEKNVLNCLVRALRQSPYDIQTANSGTEALRIMRDHEFGVIVSDFKMPSMNGAELLNEVKNLYPDTVRIILSGYADLASVTQAINEGSIYRFLFKPYENDVIIENVNEAFREYELVKENQRLARDLEKANSELAALNAGLESKVEEKTRLVSKMAQYDSLTELPNRFLFIDRLKQAISFAERNNYKVAIVFIDLDKFKKINDSFGHTVGDQVLKMVADRIGPAIRQVDTLARIGGDEFTLIVGELSSSHAVVPVIKRIMQALIESFVIEEREIYITASIGVSLYPDDGEDIKDLLKNSDAAMYHAKREGRNNFQFYSNSMNDCAMERLSLESELRHALKRNEYVLHYQPQYELGSNRLIGFEALIRWQHPTNGLLYPDSFIPILEETGMIIEVGEWVIKAACEQLMSWQNEGADSIQMAVNTSAIQFNKPDFVERVDILTKESGIDIRNGCLEIEMTESLIMDDVEKVIGTMTALRQLGIEMSIDDFGTGYSSFAYIRSFPIQTIKIDRYFIKDLENSEDAQIIVKAIIAMAHAMKLRVIAEGVETNKQKQYLESIDCDVIQGYLVGKPLDSQQAFEVLKKRN